MLFACRAKHFEHIDGPPIRFWYSLPVDLIFNNSPSVFRRISSRSLV